MNIYYLRFSYADRLDTHLLIKRHLVKKTLGDFFLFFLFFLNLRSRQESNPTIPVCQNRFFHYPHTKGNLALCVYRWDSL